MLTFVNLVVLITSVFTHLIYTFVLSESSSKQSVNDNNSAQLYNEIYHVMFHYIKTYEISYKLKLQKLR